MRIVSWNILAPGLFLYFWRKKQTVSYNKSTLNNELVSIGKVTTDHYPIITELTTEKRELLAHTIEGNDNYYNKYIHAKKDTLD